MIEWDESFEDFLDKFTVSDDILADFQGFLEADSFSFEPDSFDVHRDELLRGIRSEVAHRLWGEPERYHIMIRDDPAIHRAVALLPEAAAMYTQSRALEEEQRAAARETD